MFLSLTAGLLIGFAGGALSKRQAVPDAASRELHLASKYKFISPLLECGAQTPYPRQEYKPSERAIERIVRDRIAMKWVTRASVYFRDLGNGPWFGVDEDAHFAPASLLKVPLMMMYLKKAESDPASLRRTFSLSAADLKDIPAQVFGDGEHLEVGKPYTVEVLLERMMRFSDNRATFLLQSHMDAEKVDALTADLGIERMPDDPTQSYLSVKDAAGFFRILFNASYLSREMSERALALTANGEFRRGIASRLPKSIVVAHKFGERDSPEDGQKQFHDCGIIYYPGRPYLLCVMTRGLDYPKMAETIEDISRQIYQDFDRGLGRRAGPAG